jgi:hypothetical protein
VILVVSGKLTVVPGIDPVPAKRQAGRHSPGPLEPGPLLSLHFAMSASHSQDQLGALACAPRCRDKLAWMPRTPSVT